jgi:hypothetical protein
VPERSEVKFNKRIKRILSPLFPMVGLKAESGKLQQSGRINRPIESDHSKGIFNSFDFSSCARREGTDLTGDYFTLRSAKCLRQKEISSLAAC